MNDDGRRHAVNHPDLVNDRRVIRADDHRESVIEFEDTYRVCVGMSDVLVANAMLAGAFSDDQIHAHDYKLACGRPMSIAGSRGSKPALTLSAFRSLPAGSIYAGHHAWAGLRPHSVASDHRPLRRGGRLVRCLRAPLAAVA